jgi:hypothetical protein
MHNGASVKISLYIRRRIMDKNYTMEDELFKMEIRDDILYIYYKRGLRFDLQVSKDFVAKRIQFLAGKQYPAVVIDEGLLSMDKQARDYFASDEGISGVTAVAFIQKTLFSKMLIDFFLGTSQPNISAKAFSNTDDAVKWLKSLQGSNSI